MGEREEKEDKEVDIMEMKTNDYNEKIFLSELECSLKEMREKKRTINSNSKKSSWRDLFTMDEK